VSEDQPRTVSPEAAQPAHDRPLTLREIARRGGRQAAEAAGGEGRSERGRVGGRRLVDRVGSTGMAERGRAGGRRRAEVLDAAARSAIARKASAAARGRALDGRDGPAPEAPG
jgi:hypothetical protein